MTIRIYSTLTRALENLTPLTPGQVRMYVCGMTVYDLCHLGHARSMVAFDVVQRWLRHSGLQVTYVRNVTDIDDKIIRRATENGESIRALTDRMIAALHQDADALGIERPTLEPRATDYVPQMLYLIGQLEDKGLAYRAPSGDVNYAVRKFTGYGKLSGNHENEIAQSEGANGQPMASIWMHNGFINVDNVKMSKSLDNFFTIREVLKLYDPEVVRFFVVRSHYRSALNFSDVHLDDARASLKRLYTALHAVAPTDVPIDWQDAYAARFKAAMDEDFGTPEAVAVLFELAAEVNRSHSTQLSGLLKSLGGVLGLLQSHPQDFLQAGNEVDEAQIQALIDARAQAKASKDFAEADRLRQTLIDMGVMLKDSAQGTQWERA